MTIRISGKVVTASLLCCIALLTALHIAAYTCFSFSTCASDIPLLYNYGFYVDLGREQNIPTWFSIFQLALAACLFAIGAVNASLHGEKALPWYGLSIIFLYIGLDEMTDFHGFWAPNHVSDLGFQFGHAGFNWVYGGLIVVIAVGLLYARWLVSIESRLRWQIVLAGGVYVTGALVLEAIGGLVVDEGHLSTTYIIIFTLEEVFEMLGIAILLNALISYFGRQAVQVHFK
ncbi:MAG: hypothetical protein AAGD43_34200 [Pseudomonadota bacterium]